MIISASEILTYQMEVRFALMMVLVGNLSLKVNWCNGEPFFTSIKNWKKPLFEFFQGVIFFLCVVGFNGCKKLLGCIGGQECVVVVIVVV